MPTEADPAGQSTPRAGRWWRPVVLASVAACAACGLIYELALLTLATTVQGGGIVATSLVVAGYVAALGLGALLAKPFVERAASSFIAVEATLGLVGGVSATALYVTFTTLGSDAASLFTLVVATAAIGMLVGAEVPLLMSLLQTGRRTGSAEAGRVLADLNAADYLGALVGGLLWPFLLLPSFGMQQAAAVTGLVNVAAAAVLLTLALRGLLTRTQTVVAGLSLVVVAALLGTLLVALDGVTEWSRAKLYPDPVLSHTQSAYQEIVVTRARYNGRTDRRLYLDGTLQYSSLDEYRYTEALVQPAMANRPGEVLVLGGGDGLAARDLLAVPGVRRVVQVELDPAVLEIARTELLEDNRGSLDDPRVEVVVDDAFSWLRRGGDGAVPPGGFGAVLVDLPDPRNAALTRLYSEEFYGLVRGVTGEGGLMAVQSGSPFSTPRQFWRTVATVDSAGWGTTPYHVHVPTFGDWGFVLASADGDAPDLRLRPDVGGLRFLDPGTLEAAGRFGRDVAPMRLEPSTLDRPRILDDARRGYER
ncbi:polyamine aminopropyltransferase [Dietzia lutea]|uniref:Polyamine aminopropyltransferase n=1 Tax=Dietzia lutea TaxID=546160 RepID=A0A2S1R6S2_9ACTN|nr:polyamine aminopropyltransferase [Dietzia lutea]AWH91987.1 spermidine synthase [Dietzia lutea]